MLRKSRKYILASAALIILFLSGGASAAELEYSGYDNEDYSYIVNPYEDKILVRNFVPYSEFAAGIVTTNKSTLTVTDGTDSSWVKSEGDLVSAGDTVVIADTVTGESKTIVVSDEYEILSEDFSGIQKLRIADTEYIAGTQYLTKTGGLYGKDESDLSVGIAAENIPCDPSELEAVEGITRPKLENWLARIEMFAVSGMNVPIMAYNASDLRDRCDYTYEYKFLYTGDMDSITLQGRTDFWNSESQSRERSAVTFLTVYKDGSAKASGTGISAVFKPDSWYTVSITVKTEAVFDLYVNDVLYAENVSMRIGASQTGKYIGLEWIGFKQLFDNCTDSTLRSGAAYVDDIRVYYGGHTAPSGAGIYSESCYIDNNEYIIYTDVKNADWLAENIDFGSSTPFLYTDSTLSEEAAAISGTSVLLLRSADGRVYRYYTFASPYVDCSGIVTYVNGIEGNIISDGEIKAAVSAESPAEFGNSGVLVLAVYKDGRLIDLASDCRSIENYAVYEVTLNVTSSDGITAKAMFFDGKNFLRPYCEYALFFWIGER